MKPRMLFRCALLGSAVALILAAQAANVTQNAPAAPAHAAMLDPQPFPATLARYEARLFELTDADDEKFDPGFARHLRNLVAPQVARNAKFLGRLTSGPTDVGTYLVSGQRAYIHYGVCQAHQCDNTTMDIMFDPARDRMVGKLLDKCTPQWLGQPDAVEMALLDQRHRASFPAAVTACAGGK